MATPALESFCCALNVVNASYDNDTLYSVNGTISVSSLHTAPRINTYLAYNVCCLVSALVSILGAVYQLWPKKLTVLPPRSEERIKELLRQNSIICWLAVADLFATIGIFIRSSLWLKGSLDFEPMSSPSDIFSRLFCAISGAWIQYFYIATYFWTFIYALDIYLLSTFRRCRMFVYYGLSWGVSGVLCILGLFSLYYPSLLECAATSLSMIPNYLISYLPIIFVMIANPVLYYKASAAEWMNVRSGGAYTDVERTHFNNVKKKFRAFVVVFYICWFPNVLNGILLAILLSGTEISSTLSHISWYLMAILNPLQALLNSLVYRGLGLCAYKLFIVSVNNRLSIDHHQPSAGLQSDALDLSLESTPLLSPFQRSVFR